MGQFAIVLSYPTIHAVSHPFIHIDCQDIGASSRSPRQLTLDIVGSHLAIRSPDIEINKVAVVDFGRDPLKFVHHLSSQTQSSIFRGDSDGGNVPMPFLAVTLSLSDDYMVEKSVVGVRVQYTQELGLTVTHHLAVWCFLDEAKVRPSRQVGQVKRDAVLYTKPVSVSA